MPRSKPTIAERLAARICPNCGKPSPPRTSKHGPTPRYCNRACAVELANRNLSDGQALVPLLKAWRIDRGTGEIAKAAFARLCQIVDELNDADRNAKPNPRPRADYVAAVALSPNRQPVNELRYGQRKLAEGRRAKECQTATVA